MCIERNMLEKLLKDIGMSETYSPVIMAAFDKYANGNATLDEVVKNIGDNIDLILAE